MFEPQYSISNLLLSNIKRITEIIADLNSRSFSGIVLAELEKRAREISAFSSTSIEGNPLPLTDVKRILKTRPEHIRDTEREVLNYNKALKQLNRILKTRKKIQLGGDTILAVHTQVVDGLLPKFQTGQWRKEPVQIQDPRTRQPAFLPPDWKEVPELMNKLIEFVNQQKN